MSDIYRKSSLEKLSSPEQLDKIIKATSISSWLLLLGAGIIVISILFWTFFGEMSDEQHITGIFMHEGEVQNVYSDYTGTLDQTFVLTGDEVKDGEIIAVVSGKEVSSKYSGIINHISVAEGQPIEKGTQIAEIRTMNEETNRRLVRSYINLNTAKQLSEDMQVTIVPTTVNEEEYGHMVGSIKSIGTYGVSEEDMYRKLGDDLLVQFFRNSYGDEPVVEVIIEINTDDNTASGYEWSNRMGRNLSIQDFSYMSVRIVMNVQKPIEKLLGI